MSSPLFKTEGSVWRPGHYAHRTDRDEDDEDWVDESLPSSPLDRTFGQDPFEAGPSKATASISRSRAGTPEDTGRPDVKEEGLDDVKPEIEEFDIKEEETPMREIYSDEDEQEPEDERQCRICFSGREEEPALGRLISPCLCTGSVRVSDYA